MWAMWANILKNFVRGPSAAVTFGARPYPGALEQTAIGHAACSLQTLQYLQCSTLVGGNVGSVHTTRRLAGWCHRAPGSAPGSAPGGHLWTMWTMWALVFNRSPNRGV